MKYKVRRGYTLLGKSRDQVFRDGEIIDDTQIPIKGQEHKVEAVIEPKKPTPVEKKKPEPVKKKDEETEGPKGDVNPDGAAAGEESAQTDDQETAKVEAGGAEDETAGLP